MPANPAKNSGAERGQAARAPKLPGRRTAASSLSTTSRERRTDRDRLSLTGLDLTHYFRRGGAVFAVLGIIYLTLIPVLFESDPEWELGRPAPRALHTPFAFEIVDKEGTIRKRDAAAAQANKFFRGQPEEKVRTLELYSQWLEIAREAVAAADGEETLEPPAEKISDAFAARQMAPPDRAALGALVDLAQNEVITDRTRDFYENFLNENYVILELDVLRGLVQSGRAYLLEEPDTPVSAGTMIRAEYLREHILSHTQLRAALKRELEKTSIIPDSDIDAVDLAQLLAAMTPNTLKRDIEADRTYKRMVVSEVTPIFKSYEPGDTIVKWEEVITPQLQDAINTYYNIRQTVRMKMAAFLALLVALMSGFTLYYCRRYHSDLPLTPSNIITLAFPVVLPLVLARFILIFFPGEPAVGYGFPAALIGLLGVILIEARYALVMLVFGSILFVISAGLPPEQLFSVFLVSLIGGGAAVSATLAVRQRSDALFAGLKAGIAGGLAVLGLSGFATFAGDIWPYTVAALVSGIASGILLYPSIWVLEWLAGVTTDLRLMELTTIRHPLIRDLEERAPGTYQHTLNVSKLAEAAAQAIGANEILTRAGVLFHDIGKMEKPKYFSENQVTPDDRRIHDKLTPNMSSLIIKGHVRQGMKLAQEGGLPQRIIDFIPEHHGTTTIQYFLHKAQKQAEAEEGDHDPPDPNDFRHIGPKPQSIETAIVLLADSVEAVASAKLTGPTVDRDDIRLVVREVINQKFREEQFDECDLTLADLSRIAEAFVHTLQGRFHFRVQYPGGARGGGDKKGSSSSVQVKGPTIPPEVGVDQKAGPAKERSKSGGSGKKNGKNGGKKGKE